MGAFKTPYIISPGDPMSAVPIATNFSELEAFLSGANLDQTNIAVDGVGTEQIAANAVTAEQIRDKEVTQGKLANESRIHQLGATTVFGNTAGTNDGNYNGFVPTQYRWYTAPVTALPKWTAPCACRVFFFAQVTFKEVTSKTGHLYLSVVNGEGLSWPQDYITPYGVSLTAFSGAVLHTASVHGFKDVAKDEAITPTLVAMSSVAGGDFTFLKNVGGVTGDANASGIAGGQLTAYAIPL